MRIRLIRKYAERIDGIDLALRKVGDIFELPDHDASCLIREGWAVPDGALVLPLGTSASAGLEGADVDRLVGDVERLVAHAIEHDVRLAALAGSLSTDGHRVPSAAETHTIGSSGLGTSTIPPHSPSSIDLLATVHTLCLSAREQRSLAETILARMRRRS